MAESDSFKREKQINNTFLNEKQPVTKSIGAVIGNQAMRNATGIPDSLKARVEKKAGLSIDDVKIHYNSPKPAAVQAYAYTQGNQVYVAPGQERHLSHELGHVVQQKQGRVRPTGTINGQPLNDSSDLEREADSYR